MLVLVMLCITTTSLQAQRADDITVYIFLSETCPICQSVTLELKSLYATYHPQGVDFIGLFPSPSLSTAETRDRFEKKYSIPFPLLADVDQKMTAKFAASATPQVFVVRTRDHSVLYKGRIDNSFESIGRRRQVVTQHYLQKALENILQNKPADPMVTEPVGCFISKK